MDIKLRARLSAYSKIESLNGLNSNLPTTGESNQGDILGVNDKGQYTLYPKITHEAIDSLFTKDESDKVTTKEDIDGLFPEEEKEEVVSKEDINNLFEESEDEIGTVSFSEIDSLFK